MSRNLGAIDRVDGIARPEAAPDDTTLGRFTRALPQSTVPFEMVMPDGGVRLLGNGAPEFRVTLQDRKGLAAIMSLDEGRIADAYLAGQFDLDGDMLRPFELRRSMRDFHPVVSAWRFLQPLLTGQVRTNRRAISSHYDIDPDFFLSFLDPKTPCYTQGVYARDDETLDVATLRKFDYCFEKLGLKPGDHLLEIGPGWGAWFEYASARGVQCTGITISQASVDYLKAKGARLGHDWQILFSDLLAFETDQRFDAIVIMGVIEHLPQYDRVLQKFMSLIRPGGRIFLDGSACTKKYELSSFMVKYIYPGNHSFLVLHDFLEKLAETPLRATEILNDTHSYFLTFRQWARNFDAHRDEVIARFGEFNFRKIPALSLGCDARIPEWRAGLLSDDHPGAGRGGCERVARFRIQLEAGAVSFYSIVYRNRDFGEASMPFDGSEFLGKSSNPPGQGVWYSLKRAARALVPLAPPRPDLTHDLLTVQLLTTARALIEDERNWIQHDYETRDGRYCAVGALRYAARFMSPPDPLIAASRLLLAVARERGFSKIEKMNDRSTHARVLSAFDEAIARARGF